MTRVEELKKLVAELRESGAEQEDIAQVVHELNMEMARASRPFIKIQIGGGKAIKRRKKVIKND